MVSASAILFKPIPESVQDLAPEWLTSALSQSGVLQNNAVQSVELLPMAVRSGTTAQIHRIRLTYERSQPGLPPTMIVKMTAADPAYRQTAAAYDSYMRELLFYGRLSGRTKIRAARCYYSAGTSNPPEIFLLLEDLGGYEMGSFETGLTPERAELAVEQLALLHSTWWQNVDQPELKDVMIPAYTRDPQYLQKVTQNFSRWPEALAALGQDQVEEYRAACTHLMPCVEQAFAAITRPPLVLAHYDFHSENMFFGVRPGQDPFVIADWGSIVSGLNPAYDVARFFCTSLDPALRKERELDLLRRYLETLAAQGVRDYPLEACLSDYRDNLSMELVRFIYMTITQLPMRAEMAVKRRAILTLMMAAFIDNCLTIS